MARRTRLNAPAAALVEDGAADESGALRRGLEVMRLISPGNAVVTIDAIVEELQTTRATAQRIIATLIEHRFLRPSRDPGSFLADVSALTIGRSFLNSMDGLEVLNGTIRTFHEHEGVSITAWVRERMEGLCIANSGKSDTLVGCRYELDRFCAGRALIWGADISVRIALLERFTRARAPGDRSTGRSAALYGSFHLMETQGFCVSEATPECANLAIAFPVSGLLNGLTLAFSLENLQPNPGIEASRAKRLVDLLTDVLSRTIVS